MSRVVAEHVVLGLLLLLVTTSWLQEGVHAEDEGEHDDDPSVIVRLAQGPIEGRQVVTKAGNKGDVFRGVPYAAPPLRELRWQKPQSPKPWSELLNCRNWGPRCIQFESPDRATMLQGPKDVADSEDCLRLNIFAPSGAVENDKKLPVLFWTHGGSFTMGSAYEFGVHGLIDSFVAKDIVVVVVQYRLGPLGFLSVSNADRSAVANAGLWDVAFALDWVHMNVALFGGDATRITVAGHSAGSVITSMLSISPVTRDKVHAVALFSATSQYFPWSLPGNYWADKSRDQFAKFAECDLPSAAQMIDCLRSKDISVLTNVYAKQTEFQTTPFQIIVLPTVDGEFLVETCDLGVAHAPSLPTWITTTADEMAFFYGAIPALPYAGFKHTLDAAVPNELYENAPMLRRLALHEYLHRNGDKNDTQLLLQQFIKFWEDRLFYCPSLDEATIRREHGANVWMSEFGFWQSHAVLQNIPEHHRGAYHGVDIAYLFRTPFFVPGLMPHFQFDEKDNKVAEKYSGILAHFVKHHTPTSDATWWPSLSDEHPAVYMHVNLDNVLLNDYHRAECAFWNKLIPEMEKVELKHPVSSRKMPETPKEVDEDQWIEENYDPQHEEL